MSQNFHKHLNRCLTFMDFYGVFFGLCLIAVALFGCTPTVLQPVASNCVPIPSYSQDWQAAFAGEVDALTANHQYPHVEQFIVDSERTRSALKVCR